MGRRTQAIDLFIFCACLVRVCVCVRVCTLVYVWKSRGQSLKAWSSASIFFRRLYLFLFTATYAKLAGLVASGKFSCLCPPHPALGELELHTHSTVSLDTST